MQRACRVHCGVLGRLRLEVVLGLDELQVELRRHQRDHARGELGVCVDAGAHRGATERQLGQLFRRTAYALDPLRELVGVPAKLLA